MGKKTPLDKKLLKKIRFYSLKKRLAMTQRDRTKITAIVKQ